MRGGGGVRDYVYAPAVSQIASKGLKGEPLLLFKIKTAPACESLPNGRPIRVLPKAFAGSSRIPFPNLVVAYE